MRVDMKRYCGCAFLFYAAVSTDGVYDGVPSAHVYVCAPGRNETARERQRGTGGRGSYTYRTVRRISEPSRVVSGKLRAWTEPLPRSFPSRSDAGNV